MDTSKKKKEIGICIYVRGNFFFGALAILKIIIIIIARQIEIYYFKNPFKNFKNIKITIPYVRIESKNGNCANIEST
jgi:hypothetical protein